MFQRFILSATASLITLAAIATNPSADKTVMEATKAIPLVAIPDTAIMPKAAQRAEKEELIAPPPIRKVEKISDWEWAEAKPTNPFDVKPMTSLAVTCQPSPEFKLPIMKAPATVRYGTIIPKDTEVRGTLNSSAMTLIKGKDGVDTLYNLSMTQSKILININTETGLVTIPPQKVLDHNTYGDVYVYSCTVRDGTLSYDATKDIQGRIDANGKITMTGFGIFVAGGEHKGAWFYAYTRGDWYPANGAVNITNYDNTTNKFDVLIEQPYPNQINIYNFIGYSNPVTATMNADKTVRITPQLIYTNAFYGPFFNYPCEKVEDKYSIQTGKYTIGQGSETKITTGPWAVSARMAPTTYVAMIIDHAEISADFTLNYPTPVGGQFEGTGTASDPFKVKTANDLARLAQKTATQTSEGQYYRLENDLSLTSLSSAYQPIGDDGTPFQGTFDGNGHTISGLTLDGRGANYVGLFGYLGDKGTVKNLKIDNFNISSTGQWKAPVVADNDGTISGVTVTKTNVISNGESGGGIAARSVGLVENCSFSGSVIGVGSVAGIVGYDYGAIRKCHSDATIQRAGHLNDVYRDCGGIAGTASSIQSYKAEIRDCYFNGIINESSGYGIAGGIAAKLNNAEATNNFNTGLITHMRNDGDYDNYTGGLFGWISASTVSDSFNAGTIIKSSDIGLTSDAVGGLVGYVRVSYGSTNGGPMTMRDVSDIRRCYNSAPIISSSANAHKGIWGSTFLYSGHNPIPETFKDCWYDRQILGLDDEEYGQPTSFFTSGQLPANFSSEIWKAEANRYPILASHASTVASDLASAAPLLANGENASKVKKAITLSAPSSIIWKLLDSASSKYVDETAALKISGNTATIKNSYGTELLTAMTPDGASARVFRLAVVPQLFDGEGTAENPYLVKSAADFKTLDMAVGTYGQSHNGDYFRMTNDIDFTNNSFQGVGKGLSTAVSFGGVFDGQDHYIRNLKVKAVEFDSNGDPILGTYYNYAGLFNVLNRYATIKNLKIASDCNFEVYISGGSIAGYSEGKIENCRNYANVYGGRQYVGGIAGNVGTTGEIINCYNGGPVTIAYSGAGGIVGYNRGTISFCQNDATISGRRPDGTELNQSMMGGIAGYHNGKMESCINNGNIRAASVAGGLIGQMSTGTELNGDIRNSLNNGIVTLITEVSSRGGIVGSVNSYGQLENNYYDGGANINGAASNGALNGCEGIITSELTSGTALKGLPTSEWDYRKDAFPVLKRFCDEPLCSKLRTVFVNFPKGQSRANINKSIPLSQVDGLSWKLTTNKEFRINGNTLEVTVPTGMTMGTDTLTATLGDISKVYMIKTIPSIFEGEGNENSPYLIKTTDDMKKLAEFIDLTSFDYSGFNFRLVNDLDFTGKEWKIVCPSTVRFNADFDGNGKKFSGVSYTNTSNKIGEGSYVGCFGIVGETGHIHDLTVEGTFSTTSFSGAVAGDLYGRLTNCVNRASVTTKGNGASGVVGRVFGGGVVSNCRNEGVVTSTGTNAGGITATIKVDGRVENCVNNGDVTSLSTGAAGIAAENGGAIIGCKNLKPVVALSTVGGIVANSTADATEITDCVNEANLSVKDITSGSGCAGILVRSHNQGSNIKIENCVNNGSITAKNYTGGIIAYGYSGIELSNCINYGTISNTGGSYAGGIAAEVSTSNSAFTSKLINCVNHGKIDAHWGYAGGVTGLLSTGAIALDCYNDADVTLTPYTSGAITQLSQYLAVGGFAGSIRGHAERCWNSGNVTSDYTAIGGFTGIAQSSEGLVIIENCFNIGNVTAKGLLDHTSGHAGGLCGYTVSYPQIHNFFNLGEVKGKKNIAGLAGMLHGTTTMVNCYNAGKVTPLTSTNAWANIANISGNGDWDVTNVFYNSDVNNAGANDKPQFALSTVELFKAPLGDGFKYSPASYPLIPEIEVEEPVAYEAAFASPMKEDDEPTKLTGAVYVGNSEKVDWTGTDHFIIMNGIAYTQKLGEATLTASSRAAEKSKSFKFVISKVSSVETTLADKEIKSRVFIDLNGFAVTDNPVSGKVYILRTEYTDGTSSSIKVLVP